MFPPVPDWDSLHPLVIHFPIALLLVAPVLMIAGILTPRLFRCFSIGALVLIILGVGGAFLAVATGEAAAELAERTPRINALIERHEELAETTRTVFLILGLVYAAIVLGPMLIRRQVSRRIILPIAGVFVLVYIGSLLLLVNTAHLGGLLVHQEGVHAMFAAPGVHAVTEEESED